MKDTKYAYAIDDPQVSPGGFPALGSHGLPFRQANIMFGHASPVAHLYRDTHIISIPEYSTQIECLLWCFE